MWWDFWSGYNEQTLEYTGHREGLVAITDPIDIPEVKDIIDRVTEKALNRGVEKQLGSHHSSTLTNDKAGGQDLLNLPLDLKLLVLDCLRPADTQSILAATGWQVPDSYWRSRSPRIIIFEIEELDPTVKVDWALFCQEAEELVESRSSLGLQNRQRIFRILEGTKNLFFSALGEKELKN